MLDSANWIWGEWDGSPNQYILARQSFAAKAGSKVVLYISADSNYTAYINGGLAAFGQSADYPDSKKYDIVEISDQIADGNNEMEILAYCQVKDSSVYRAGRPALIFCVEVNGKITACSGKDTMVSNVTGFKDGEIDRVSGQMGYTFEFDANSAEPVWTSAELIDYPTAPEPRSDKMLTIAKTGDSGLSDIVSQGVYCNSTINDTLGKRMQYAAMAYREKGDLSAPDKDSKGINYSSDDGDGIYVTRDLGCETTGFLHLELTVDEPAEILIGWGEHLDDQRVRTYVGGRNFAARYCAKPGNNVFTYTIRRVAARYLTLFVSAHSFSLQSVTILPVEYPLSLTGSFKTCDAMARRIYDVSINTLKACLHEHYEDCPWREQALYAMDSRNQMLFGYYAFNEYDAPRNSMRLIAKSIRDDGLPELCSPARVAITIPSFALDFIFEIEEYMMYSGDMAFTAEMLPFARIIVDSMAARIDDTGLVPAYADPKYWNFYEWRPGLDGNLEDRSGLRETRYDAPLNMLLCESMLRIAHIMAELGIDGGEKYKAGAERLAAAIDKSFWNEERGVYITYIGNGTTEHCCELTNALAVYCHVCPSNRKSMVLEALTSQNLIPVSLSYSIFLYDALLSGGGRYSRFVFDQVSEIWGEMISKGATTFWETEKGGWDFNRAGSLCHAWSAVPLYLYYAYALGIRPQKPGFREYTVSPVDSGLYELHGAVKKPDGEYITVGNYN